MVHPSRSGSSCKVSLRLILVVPFLLQIVAAVGFTGWFSLRNGQQNVHDLAAQLCQEVGDRVDQHLSSYLMGPQQLSQTIKSTFDVGALDPNHLERINQYFYKQMQLYDVDYISFTSTSGNVTTVQRDPDGRISTNTLVLQGANSRGVSSEPSETSPFHPSHEMASFKEPRYANRLQEGQPVWSLVHQEEKSPDILSISANVPILNSADQVVGVVSVDQHLSEISEFLRQLKISPSGRIFIVEHTGLLIASSSSESPYTVTNGYATRLNASDSHDPIIHATTNYLMQQFGSFRYIERGFSLSAEIEGEWQFIQVIPWHDEWGLDWLIVLTVPQSGFLTMIDANTQLTVLLYLTALAGAIVAGLFTSRWLLKPILNTIQAADALSKGDWEQQLPESRSEELSMLARAFNRMAIQLQGSFLQLEYNANHDALTGLLNQRAFWFKLEEAIADYQSRKNSPKSSAFAVLFLDLDYFKLVNDSLGHLIGDQLLMEVAKRLMNCVQSSHAVARFGGDEFAVLLDNIVDGMDATHVAERISYELQKPFHLGSIEIFISTSIGIVLSSSECDQTESYLRNADIALYRAKANGKAKYEVFDQDMHTEAVERLQLETDLRRAIERQELEVHYQPIVDLKTLQIKGFEALLRWHHPLKGMVSPTRFIPIAEETGLIAPIGWWVLRESCHQMRQWQQRFEHCESMVISINLSGKQFFQSDIQVQIEQILKETGLAHANLKLEITESTFMNYGEATHFKLKRLRSSGIQLSIDDFGTGYSSLSYLHRFPINTIKIDRSFISRLGTSRENSDIVEAIAVLAHKIGMDIVAEGVETAEQLQHLQAMGCEQAQGYLFSKPLPAEAVTQLLLKPYALRHLD